MKSFLGKFLFLLLLVLPTTLMIFETGKSIALAAEDGGGDAMEGEDEDVNVETEDGAEEPEAAVTETEKGEEEEEETLQLKPSEDADVITLFTKPTGTTDLPAGKLVRFLVGFTNKGDKKFTLESLGASFRYPQDYNFFIQNFTAATYNMEVEAKRQATVEYAFSPPESFAARPFGLTILLDYKDEDGNAFQNAVFNETVNIIEPDEGLDGETFFLYVFLAALAVLLMVGAQQFLGTFSRKHLSKPKPKVEMGTQNSDIDYDWIPKEALQKNSPGRSPKQSPRQRRSKRATSSGEE
ncbi:translocon-associated protein subunit alpha-like [Mytilus californianus]|uniref:translocon-associated protein subunit alpha-like n=1 Tax=Mytilus californianus TaxID=6549 RepID=UPI0022451545|nr:translocon-associated protein subunit alpha-like [Mytilus californianus]